MTEPATQQDKPDAEPLQSIRADIAQIRGDLGDLKAEIMLLRVIIENAARLMADATQEPRTDRLT
jgi:hypothetical protein